MHDGKQEDLTNKVEEVIGEEKELVAWSGSFVSIGQSALERIRSASWAREGEEEWVREDDIHCHYITLVSSSLITLVKIS
jgi:hypothetical protein